MKKAPAHPVPPTSASAQWVDGERFLTGGSSGHAVVLDADRGRNSGPGPMEMVLRSLCACSAVDVVVVMQKSRQALAGLEVSARGSRAPEPPAVYTSIHLTYRMTGRGLERAVAERAVALSQSKYCSVYAMLGHTAAMTHEIVLEEAAR